MRPTPYLELSKEIVSNGYTHASRVYWVRIGELLDSAANQPRYNWKRTRTARMIRAYRNAWNTLTS